MPSDKQIKLLNKFKSFPPEDKKMTKQAIKEIENLIKETSIDCKDDQGRTILHYAVHPKRKSLLKLVVEHSDFELIKDNETNMDNTAIWNAAVYHGNFEAYKILDEKKAKYSKNKLYKRLKEKIKDDDIDQGKRDQYKIIADFIYRVTPKKINSNEPGEYWGIYAYPTPDEKSKLAVQSKEFEKQKQVTERFFWVGRSLEDGKSSTKLYKELNAGAADNKPIDLDGYSARSAVIAVSKVLQEKKKFPAVTFKIGDTLLECNPAEEKKSMRQVGNFFAKIIQLNSAPQYRDEIMKTMVPIVSAPDSTLRNRKLAFLFRRKGKKIASFRQDEFNQQGQIKLKDEKPYDPSKESKNQNGQRPIKDQIQSTIHVLNFLNFMHTIGEVVRRLYRTNSGEVFAYESKQHIEKYMDRGKDPNGKPLGKYFGLIGQKRKASLKLAIPSDEFPVASFHARAMILMENKYLKINDIYGTSGYSEICFIYDFDQSQDIINDSLDIYELPKLFAAYILTRDNKLCYGERGSPIHVIEQVDISKLKELKLCDAPKKKKDFNYEYLTEDDLTSIQTTIEEKKGCCITPFPKYGVVSGLNSIHYIEKQCVPKGRAINNKMSDHHSQEYGDKYPKHYYLTRPFWIKSELYRQFGGKSESDNDYNSFSSDSSDFLSENEDDTATSGDDIAKIQKGVKNMKLK